MQIQNRRMQIHYYNVLGHYYSDFDSAPDNCYSDVDASLRSSYCDLASVVVCFLYHAI